MKTAPYSIYIKKQSVYHNNHIRDELEVCQDKIDFSRFNMH